MGFTGAKAEGTHILRNRVGEFEKNEEEIQNRLKLLLRFALVCDSDTMPKNVLAARNELIQIFMKDAV